MLRTWVFRILAGTALASLAVFVLTGGCAEGILDGSALSTLSATTTTASDKQDSATATETTTTATLTNATDGTGTIVVSTGAAILAGDGEISGMMHLGPQLTAEQQAALAALLDQLNAGTITQDEFCQQVHDIIGDPPCETPLPPIDLTAEQQAQAQTIFQQARDQVVALHATARDQVVGLLTAEQQAALAELEQPPAPPDGPEAPPAPLCPLAENAACARPVPVPLPPCPDSNGMPPDPDPNALPDPNAMPPMGPGHGGHPPMGGGQPGRPPMGHGQGGPRPLCLNDEVITTLVLTPDQITAIEAIHTALQTSEAEVRDAADQAFRAILTEAQLAELDQLPPPPPGGPHPPR
jgi:hypothetical protein